MDILETIVAAKRKQIEPFKQRSPVERFERDGFFWQISNRSLVQHLLQPDSTGIIAEFKRKSPSKGWFKTKELEVEPVVAAYNKSAAGISVLTDDEFFLLLKCRKSAGNGCPHADLKNCMAGLN